MCDSKGQDYKPGDKLRLVGGTPTSQSDTVRTGIVALRIVNAGEGYGIDGSEVELIGIIFYVCLSIIG